MKELRQKNDEELRAFVTEKREELRKLRFSAAGSGMRDVKSIANTKRAIARALTELTSRAKEPQA